MTSADEERESGGHISDFGKNLGLVEFFGKRCHNLLGINSMR
jgi:hypothetical protein